MSCLLCGAWVCVATLVMSACQHGAARACLLGSQSRCLEAHTWSWGAVCPEDGFGEALLVLESISSPRGDHKCSQHGRGLCVCMCVCVWGERETQRPVDTRIHTFLPFHNLQDWNTRQALQPAAFWVLNTQVQFTYWAVGTGGLEGHSFLHQKSQSDWRMLDSWPAGPQVPDTSLSVTDNRMQIKSLQTQSLFYYVGECNHPLPQDFYENRWNKWEGHPIIARYNTLHCCGPAKLKPYYYVIQNNSIYLSGLLKLFILVVMPTHLFKREESFRGESLVFMVNFEIGDLS